jgi:superfamily I DNA/RNA helicase
MAHVGCAHLRRLQQRAVRHLRALTGLCGLVAIVANPKIRLIEAGPGAGKTKTVVARFRK